MPQFLNRIIENSLGSLADTMLRIWDAPSLRRLRRKITRVLRHRRAVIRRLERTSRIFTFLERCWQIPVLVLIACGRGIIAMARRFHRTSRIIALVISRALRSRFARQCGSGVRGLGSHIARGIAVGIHAQAEAWRWLGRLALRPFRRTASAAGSTGAGAKKRMVADVAPTNATMPDGIMALMTCAACGHEVMGTNMKKYYKFRCPRCKASLLVIDAPKGLSMQVVAGDRRQATRIEKIETEESEPVKL